MIAAQQKKQQTNITTQDAKQEKLLTFGRDKFQDPTLSPFCVVVGGTTRRVLSDA